MCLRHKQVLCVDGSDELLVNAQADKASIRHTQQHIILLLSSLTEEHSRAQHKDCSHSKGLHIMQQQSTVVA